MPHSPAEPTTVPIGENQNAAEVSREYTPTVNGGRIAWLQVSAAFALYWNSLGLVNSFGVFQTYYERALLNSEASSAISWIGSVQVFFLMAGGIFLGPLYDMGHGRSMVIAGSFLVPLGFMMTSISKEYYQVLLSQGLAIGLGTSFLYIPAITLVPGYFVTRRALPMGTAAIGSSCGAIIYPLLFERLQPQIGFPWTVRVLGFVSLALCLYATLVLRQRPVLKKSDLSKRFKAGSVKDVVELAGLLDLRYVVQSIAIFFSNLTFFVPLYYLQPYAQTHGMTDPNLGKYLLVILNAAAIPGRIIPSYIAGKAGVINTYIAICAFTTVVVFYWISVTNEAGNIAFSVLYGFFSGSVVTLAPVVLTAITDDLGMLGTRLGFVALLKGIGSLIGPPIAGAILDNTRVYLGLQLFTGLGFLLTTLLAGQLRIVVARRKVQKSGSIPNAEPERA